MPQRVPSPFSPATSIPVVEPIVQPIYGTALVTDTGGAASFNVFNNNQADAPGREVDTNLRVTGQLSYPTFHIVRAICLDWDQVDNSANFVGGTPVAATLSSGLQRIVYQHYFTFFVGLKTYAEGPAFLFPSLFMPKGFAAVAIEVPAATVENVEALELGQPGGIVWSTDRHRITIPSQQNFGGVFRRDWDVGTLASSPFMTGGWRVTAFLVGRFAREVQ